MLLYLRYTAYMTPRDVVELAWQRFRTRSLRFLLTVFGVGIAIGVVFFLVTLGFGLQEVVIGRIATSESLLALTIAVSEEAKEVLIINDATLDGFRAIPHVADIAPLLSVPAEINYGELKAQTLAQGVPASHFIYAGIEPAGGELLKDGQEDEVVVTTTMMRLFGLNETDALGKELALTFFFPREATTEPVASPGLEPLTGTDPATSDINIVTIPHKFKIVGFIESDSNSFFVPISVFNPIPQRTYSQVRVRVDDAANIDVVRKQLLDQGYSVIALTDTLEQLNNVFKITQGALGALGIVALFIASVGMFNTLTISLLERTHEVGVLKTIGATNRDVWMIFLFEAVLIGALGGVAGILGGLAFSKIVNILINQLAARYGGDPVKIFATPLWFLITILSISVIVGLVTGLYPAHRAATLNPLQALKRE